MRHETGFFPHSGSIEMALDYCTINHFMISLLYTLLTSYVILLEQNIVYLCVCMMTSLFRLYPFWGFISILYKYHYCI